MSYQLLKQQGDFLPVPQVVLNQLARVDGDTIRVALYILQNKDFDPHSIAHVLGLKTVETANRALMFWEGAGLLEKVRTAPPPLPQPRKTEEIRLSEINDPNVTLLCNEAQSIFGRNLSRDEMLLLVVLYTEDGWKPDVLLPCCVEMIRQGHNTVGSIRRELIRWRKDGVETGEDVERHLQRLAKQRELLEQTVPLFNTEVKLLTSWEQKTILRWYEDWQMGQPMIEEALIYADDNRTVRYVNGILKRWRQQGIDTVEAARGLGQLIGSNILSTGKKTGKESPKKDLLNQDWSTVFDD